MTTSWVEKPKQPDGFTNELDLWVVDRDHRTYDLKEYLHPYASLLSISCLSSIDYNYFRADTAGKIFSVDIENMPENGQYPNAILLSVIVEFQGRNFRKGFLVTLANYPCIAVRNFRYIETDEDKAS